MAIGNGTASRETDKLVQDVMKRYPEARLNKIVVSKPAPRSIPLLSLLPVNSLILTFQSVARFLLRVVCKRPAGRIGED